MQIQATVFIKKRKRCVNLKQQRHVNDFLSSRRVSLSGDLADEANWKDCSVSFCPEGQEGGGILSLQ